MEAYSNSNLHFTQKKSIRSFSVEKSDLRRLLELLQERSLAASDIEIANLTKLDDQTDEDYEKEKLEIREKFEFL